MPRILIAGCGYLGQATADLFHAAGWSVEGWTVSKESAATLSAKPYSIRQVDISDRDQVARRRGTFDAVVHCASSRGSGSNAARGLRRCAPRCYGVTARRWTWRRWGRGGPAEGGRCSCRAGDVARLGRSLALPVLGGVSPGPARAARGTFRRAGLSRRGPRRRGGRGGD